MSHETPDRRSVIAGGAAFAGAAMLPSAGAAQTVGVGHRNRWGHRWVLQMRCTLRY